MKYKVQWTEIHIQEAIIEADSPEDAIDRAPYEEDKETIEVAIDPSPPYIEEVE